VAGVHPTVIAMLAMIVAIAVITMPVLIMALNRVHIRFVLVVDLVFGVDCIFGLRFKHRLLSTRFVLSLVRRLLAVWGIGR
jgi:hypothetical protein